MAAIEMGDRSKRRKVGFKADKNADEYCLAKDCIRLHLISTSDEFHRKSNSFSPDFLEEYFGESGKIYGYKGLTVDIWLHDSSFHAYAEVKYDALMPVSGRKKSHKDVQSILKEIFGAGLVEDRNLFLENLQTYSIQFSDMINKRGEKLASWLPPNDSFVGAPKQNEIIRLELISTEARDWHARLNPLVLLFVEGASSIDAEDPLWEVYVVAETTKRMDSLVYKVTGFCNVYRFFHYPDSSRLRISQILVLPPYQNKHYGYRLLNTINDVALQRDCYDVTMEDPSDKLQEVRECMDVVRLLSCSPVIAALNDAVLSIAGKNGKEVSSLKNRALLLPPPDVASLVRKQFKISKMQFKRCWEALLLLHLDPLDVAARNEFRDLMLDKLCAEIFENKENKEPAKRVIDTENEYDSTKTFVMMRFKERNSEAGAEDGENLSEQQPNRDEALEELLKERQKQIIAVVHKVSGLCKLRDIPIQFNPQAWLDEQANA